MCRIEKNKQEIQLCGMKGDYILNAVNVIHYNINPLNVGVAANLLRVKCLSTWTLIVYTHLQNGLQENG